MLHLVLALFIICLAMGVAVVFLSFLALIRFSAIAYRRLAAVVGGGLLTMIVDLLKEYDRAVPGDMSSALLPLYVVLSAVGLALLGFATPALAFQLTGRKTGNVERAAEILPAALLVCLGVWRELAPGALSSYSVVACLAVVQAYGFILLWSGRGRIANKHVRQLVETVLTMAPLLLVLVIAQFVVTGFSWAPPIIKEFPIAEILYLLVMECLLLVYGLRYLFIQEPAVASVLPEQFIEKYSISPRECEIILMIIQGFSNSMIGEKLYISAMTVKNHIYHIYQKTSVVNKIQLVILINSLK